MKIPKDLYANALVSFKMTASSSLMKEGFCLIFFSLFLITFRKFIYGLFSYSFPHGFLFSSILSIFPLFLYGKSAVKTKSPMFLLHSIFDRKNSYALLLGLFSYITGALFTFFILNIFNISFSDKLSDSILNIFRSASLLDKILTIITVVMAAPVFEEVVFRYCFFNGISKILKKWDILLTVTAFSFIHLYSWKAFLFSVITGFFFTYFYKKYQKLAFSIIMHSAVNLTGITVGLFLDGIL